MIMQQFPGQTSDSFKHAFIALSTGMQVQYIIKLNPGVYIFLKNHQLTPCSPGKFQGGQNVRIVRIVFF